MAQTNYDVKRTEFHPYTQSSKQSQPYLLTSFLQVFTTILLQVKYLGDYLIRSPLIHIITKRDNCAYSFKNMKACSLFDSSLRNYKKINWAQYWRRSQRMFYPTFDATVCLLKTELEPKYYIFQWCISEGNVFMKYWIELWSSGSSKLKVAWH